MKLLPRSHVVRLSFVFAVSIISALALFHRLPAQTDRSDGRLPLSPREELATFKVPKGFRVELVACEPEVVDPVAMAFDEDGKLYVAEMLGYPNEGVATGTITSGRIRCLEDRDGDGFYETVTVFAEGLRFPTSVMPWKNGLLVANCPDLLYLEDRNRDGKADGRQVLYTGFGLSNIQQLLNGFQLGLDNWIYACSGANPSTIKSLEKPELPPISLRGRSVRFRPWAPGSLEPTSGGGQYGLSADDGQHWFTATNSQHLRHIVLEDRYLRRNPGLAVSAVTLDIPDHGAACKVFRISPFEGWREERTRRRREGADARRFPSTELVPGGYITSACSPVIYTADQWPAAYRGNSFVCDPANNLIHRDTLEEKGSTYVAHRAEPDCEFLASTDTWFRPVFMMLGPDGAVYVADFYREVIETPLSLPDDIKKRLNLQSRGRGRIWRIVRDGQPREKRPNLSKASAAELVECLKKDNSWWRFTAQRLLLERQDRSTVPALEELAAHSPSWQTRIHALWMLDGLQSLRPELILTGLNDKQPGVREQAIRLAESRLRKQPELLQATLALTSDPAPKVRLQLALCLGETDDERVAPTLVKLALAKEEDTWMQTAVLSSAHRKASKMLGLLLEESRPQANIADQLRLATRLAAMAGATGLDTEIQGVLTLIQQKSADDRRWQIALLQGLGQGLQDSRRSLSKLWQSSSPELAAALNKTRPVFAEAAQEAGQDARPLARRQQALNLLRYGPFSILAEITPGLLGPRQPQEIQVAVVRALTAHDSPQVAELLVQAWPALSPAVRSEATEALFAREDRLRVLLQAVKQDRIPAAQLDSFRLEQLRKAPGAALRKEAQQILDRRKSTDRQKVVDSYKDALTLKGDIERGRGVFRKNCTSCHLLEGVGKEVGANLLAALANKTPEAILIDVFDPSREVDPRYLNYVVTMQSGKVHTGIIASETANSVTLRRADRAEDTLLRAQIEEIQATAKSLMPENLESQLNKQDVADLIAYLRSVALPK